MSPQGSWNWPAILAMLIGVCAGAVHAGDNVRVSVVSILASDRHDVIDPKLECLAREVKKVDPNLTGFTLVKITCMSLAVGAKEKMALADGQTAAVSIDRWTGEDKKERVQLKITPPLLGEITYTCACGKFLPIITRYRTAKNELLILAVRVQHCGGGNKDKGK